MLAHERDRKAIKAWRPAPPRGPIRPGDVVSDDSAEAVAVAWLEAWRVRDFGAMADHIQISRRLRAAKLAETLEADFGFRELVSYVVETVVEQAPAKTQITALLTFVEDGPVRMTANLIYEDAAGRAVVHRREAGHWGLNEISALAQEAV